ASAGRLSVGALGTDKRVCVSLALRPRGARFLHYARAPQGRAGRSNVRTAFVVQSSHICVSLGFGCSADSREKSNSNGGKRMRLAHNTMYRSQVQISVVVPLFNEEENLEALHRRLSLALDSLGDEYELVLVNDGSRDETPRLLNDLTEVD